MGCVKIGVVGAGAMGCLFGGWLARAGLEVILLDVWSEHVRILNEKGLELQEGDELLNIPVRATEAPEELGDCGLVLVFVKSYYTREAVEPVAANLRSDAVFLTLQNGMGNAEEIQRLWREDGVLVGTTAHGSTLLGPGRVRHAGRGETLLGPWARTRLETAYWAGDILARGGFSVRVRDDILGVLWEKLLVNVGINALTALTGMRNGQILEDPDAEALLEEAVLEARSVAEALGISLREDILAHVKGVAKRTAQNRSSMLQDLMRGRRTEIDVINGVVVREGRRLGISTPVNATLSRLVHIVQTLQSLPPN
jgi:2-dehydropantoate 2-reductase